MKKSKYDKRLSVAKYMPPMKRRSDKVYTPQTDPCFCWLMKQPDIISYIFDLVKRIGYIQYDAEAGIYKGIEYND